MADLYPDSRPRRARLDATLDRMAHCNAIFVGAPPGHGKSVLLARWRRLLISTGRTVCWAGGGAQPSLRRLCADICGVPEDSLPSAPDAIRDHLRAFLTAQDRGVTILTDDLHRIADPALETALATIIAHLPPGVQWIFASRHPVPDAWLGLLAYRSLGLVDASLLRFTSAEATELLSDAEPGRVADPALIEQAGGVPLFVDLIRQHVASDAGADPVSGLAAWLDAHVWPHLPPDIQPLVDDLALLGTEPLSAGLVDAVAGHAGGQAVLDTLRSATPLLLPAGKDDRFHPFALHVLPGAPVDARRRTEIHRRAALWFADRRPHAAISHALAADETDLACTLIERALLDAISGGRVAQALEWLRTIPVSALTDRPGMDATIAWALTIGGRLDEAEAWLSEASARAALDASGFNTLVHALIACERDDPDQCKRLVDRLTPDQIAALPPTFGAVHRNMIAWIEFYAGAPRMPGIAVRLPATDARRDPRQLYSLCFAAYRDLESALEAGHAQEAIRQGQPLFDLVRSELGLASAAASMLATGLAAAHRQSGDMMTAANLLASQPDDGKGGGWVLPSSVWLAARTRARIARDSGDFATSIEIVEQFRAAASQRSLHRLAALALVELIRAYCGAGARAQVRACVEALAPLRVLGREAGPIQERQIELAAATGLAHAALFDQDWRTAAAMIRRGHVIAARLRRALDGAELEMLAEAIPPSAPRPRLAARQMRDLVAERDRAIVAQDLSATPTNRPPASSRRAAPTVPELTAKERDVLELVAAGVGNKLIAKALLVSPETVKWHLKNIFNKLEVHDRRNVVARARALDLIA